ncbi:MAG: sugar phosphate isomerase/epimerase family protein [Actinomycetota bacterium]
MSDDGGLRVAYTVMSPEATTTMGTAYPGKLADAVDELRQAGYDGVELQVEAPADFPLREVTDQLERHGLGVSALATGPMRQHRGLSLSSADPAIRARTLSEARILIGHAAEIGTDISLGSILDPDIVFDHVPHDELLAESLSQLAGYAERTGARILVEPQNPEQVTLLTEVRAAEEFLERHGLQRVGLIFDTFHVVRSGLVAADELAHAAGLPVLVQIAGTAARGAVEYPDEQLEDFLDSLLTRGYRGWITMEHLQTSGLETPARSLAGLERLVSSVKERSS